MSTNGRVIVGQYKGRPVSHIQDHSFSDQEGNVFLKTRYEYADKTTDKGKPDKAFQWPKGIDLTALHLFGWEGLAQLTTGEPIILVEGETNVEAAISRGLIAVCTPQPTGPSIACLRELAAYPQNPIYISPDNDWNGTGVEKARAWYEFLSAIHPELHWMPPAHPKDGGDLKDLLDTFGPDADKEARAAVVALMRQATPAPPTIKPATSVDTSVYGKGEDFNDLADEPDEEMVAYGLFSEGTWIIAGAPKLGKSWFALSYAHGLSIGGAILGSVKVEQADVLAFILEDGRRRYKKRIKRRIENLPRPPRGQFTIWFKWPRLEDEALNRMRAMVAVRAAAGRRVCVVIDTGTKLRPMEDRHNGNVYMSDYGFLDPITEMAQEYHALVLVIAHTRKAPSTDFIDSVIGSHGISGAVDGIAVLSRERHSKRATIEWTGRDGEEDRRTLQWDVLSDGWLITAESDTATEKRRAVEKVVEQIALAITNAGRPLSNSEIKLSMHQRVEVVVEALNLGVEWEMLNATGTGKRGDPVMYSVPGIDSEGGTE